MTQPKFECPACHGFTWKAYNSRPDRSGLAYTRYRECLTCHSKFLSEERIIRPVAFRKPKRVQFL